MEKESNFTKIFAEICLGYSQKIWKDSEVYIKHFSNLDSIELESFYDSVLEKAKLSGIKTYAEKLTWLTDKKMWDKHKDIEVNQQKDYVDSLQKTLEKLVFKSQKIQVEKTLQEETKKLDLLLDIKENLIGITAEKIANQKMQFYYVYTSFFADKELKNKFFTLKDIDKLDDEDSYDLLFLYVKNIERFNIKNINKIAISNFFTNNFYICGENLYSFFNKPIYLLTNYQLNLLSSGLYFKNIFSSNHDLPKEIKDDPEKIEEFIQKNRGFKEMLSKVDSGAQSIGIVASNEDFKEMGLRQDTSFLNSKGPSAEK